MGTEKGPCSKRGSLGGLGCKHRAQTPGRPPQTHPRPAPARAAAQARPQSLRVPPGPAPISTQSRPGSEGLSCRNTGANDPLPLPLPQLPSLRARPGLAPHAPSPAATQELPSSAKTGCALSLPGLALGLYPRPPPVEAPPRGSPAPDPPRRVLIGPRLHCGLSVGCRLINSRC